MTLTRRSVALALLGLPLAGALRSAHAATMQPYTAEAFARATKAGGPSSSMSMPLVPAVPRQENILNRLMSEPKFAGATFLRVSYDGQKDVVEKLNVPRSTLIAFKGTRETGRMSWGVTEDSVVKVLDTAY